MTSGVRLFNVTKRFRVGENHDSLRDLLVNSAKRIFGGGRCASEQTYTAVENVSFEARPGEAVGIIGPNGAGKSTVLKLLAGILRPDDGHIEVRGRRAALIEVGAGFHGDLTGRENIHLNGTILGMTRDEIRRKMGDIVAFAGVDRFLDTPVKRYSSGMYARLGFSIAAHVDPEVLLVDEVLSVGDAAFRLRCLERMQSLVRGGTSLVFVTHDLEQMRAICNRTIVLEHGRVAFEGKPAAAIAHYLTALARCGADRPTDVGGHEVYGHNRMELKQLRILNEAGRETNTVNPRERLTVEAVVRSSRIIRRAVVELNLRRAEGGEIIATFNSGRSRRYFRLVIDQNIVRLRLGSLPISSGQYFWNLRVWDTEAAKTELDSPFQCPLIVDDGGCTTGMLSVEHDWVGDASLNDGFAVTACTTDVSLARRKEETVESLPVR